MSIGGFTTSDIGDPRSGEASYAGTSSVAGTAQQMGRDVQDVADAMDYYQSVMSAADESNMSLDNERLASALALASMPQQAAPTAAEAEAGLLNMLQTQRINELSGMMTPVNFGRTGGNIGVLENLAMRAGQAPKPAGGFFSNMPSFLGTAARAIGEKSSMAMYDDIVNKGYIPQYDAAGQIVATINPETGQYGVGSVEARIADYDSGISERDEPEELTMTSLQDVQADLPEAVQASIAPTPASSGRYYRRTLLDDAPQVYGGLLTGQTPMDFERMNRDFRISGATYPEYFQDPYDMEGYTLL